MSKPRKFHLFNCDNIYELSVVEDLLKAARSKLGFAFSVEKHSFTLREMSELSTKTIPEMKIDFAMFVVHAHESVLSINNDNLEHGYTEVYRALLQATGGNVIVVIGGDDNYKNETEEEQSVISRWAWRKIAHPQFKAEFIDGRKSFVFSWNKQHRAIHEEALLHYFDPNKKGQRFEYQPPQKPSPQKRSPMRATGLERDATKEDSVQQLSSVASYLQMGKEISCKAEGRRKEFNTSSPCTDLVILGCNASEYSMQGARKVFQDIVPKVNLAGSPPVVNLSPAEAKRYLIRNQLKSCVLVMEAVTVKDACENLPQGIIEYEDLLETAANEVGEKVLILICETASLKSKGDEAIVGKTIERIINGKEKGFVAWLKNGKLSVDPDVLVQFLISTTPAPQPRAQTSLSRDSVQEMTNVSPVSAAESVSTCSDQPQRDRRQRNLSEWETGPRWNVSNMQQPAPQAAATINQWSPPAVTITGQPVMLRTLLRYGQISYDLDDIQLWDPEFVVPDYITQGLLHQHCNTPVTGVKIVLDDDGQLQPTIDPMLIEISRSRNEGVQIAANEKLQLKTRIRYGLVSFQESDVFFRFGNFQIPQVIVDGLRDENRSTPLGELYIISDEKGNFRSKVNIGPISRMLTFASNYGL